MSLQAVLRFFRNHWRSSFDAEVKQELLWLGPLAIIVLVLVITSVLVSRALGLSIPDMEFYYVHKAWKAAPWLAVLGGIGYVLFLVVIGERKPIKRICSALRAQTRLSSLLSKIVPFALMPLLLKSQSILKITIPKAQGFAFDDVFSDLDRVLAFGMDPWRITHYFLGSPDAIYWIQWLYSIWIPLLAVTISCFAWSSNREAKARFFLTYALCWVILGTLLAHALSSAGPCFLAGLGAEAAPRYSELMARLHEIDLGLGGSAQEPAMIFLSWQAKLWQGYLDGEIRFGIGISAMPSMHLSIVTLYWLSARRAHWVLRMLTLWYIVVIFIGSVHLGWHYAADGLLSIVGTVLIWKLVDWYLSWVGLTQSGAARGKVRILQESAV